VGRAFAAARDAGLGIGTRDYDQDAFPNPFA
jgi:hypothetical protein